MLSRKKARESAYMLIYEYLFLKTPNERSLMIFTSAEFMDEEINYIRSVYYGVIEKYDELIEIIKNNSGKFSVERIFKLDLAALLLAIYEMKHIDTIPMTVSISEAVELVKAFSTEKSYQYVNGILSSVYKLLGGDNANN